MSGIPPITDRLAQVWRKSVEVQRRLNASVLTRFLYQRRLTARLPFVTEQ